LPGRRPADSREEKIMRMHHHDAFINFPLAMIWMASGYWLKAFESGSWFFGTLLPYIGFVAACGQVFLIYRKLRRRN
jgi:hypothetical protein